MAVRICIRESACEIPTEDAAMLADQLRQYATGFRGDIDDPAPAAALAEAIEQRLAGAARGAVTVEDPAALDALHRVLNSIVHEVGPAMELYSAVDAALRAA